ncbi:transposase [Burkholderia sp. SCN-KJ]
MNDRLKYLSRESDLCRRLQTIPGVGVLLSTAIVSAVGNASTVRRARDLAVRVELVPRQHTTGGKPRLLGITKQLSASPIRAGRPRAVSTERQASQRSDPAPANPTCRTPTCAHCGLRADKQTRTHCMGSHPKRRGV